jgi:alpha-glucosidase
MELGEKVIAFRRDELICLVNFGPEPVALPEGAGIILASVPIVDTVPADTAVWLRSGS